MDLRSFSCMLNNIRFTFKPHKTHVWPSNAGLSWEKPKSTKLQRGTGLDPQGSRGNTWCCIVTVNKYLYKHLWISSLTFKIQIWLLQIDHDVLIDLDRSSGCCDQTQKIRSAGLSGAVRGCEGPWDHPGWRCSSVMLVPSWSPLQVSLALHMALSLMLVAAHASLNKVCQYYFTNSS